MTWGGARKGAGRKPKAEAPSKPKAEQQPEAPPLTLEVLAAVYAGRSPEEIMDLSMRAAAAIGDYDAASRAAARLEAARARKAPPQPGAQPGKKQAASAAAETAGQDSGWGDDLTPPRGRPN